MLDANGRGCAIRCNFVRRHWNPPVVRTMSAGKGPLSNGYDSRVLLFLALCNESRNLSQVAKYAFLLENDPDRKNN